MKKLISLFFVALSLVISANAYALECKTGNYGSDECWTTAVLRQTGELTSNLVAGTVMVYDIETPTQHGVDPNDPDRVSFTVRAAGATRDNYLIAGVLQHGYNATSNPIASGDRVQLLVRGKGVIRSATSTVSTGDRFYVNAQSGAGNFGEARAIPPKEGNVVTNTADKAIAWALENATAVGTNDAFITII